MSLEGEELSGELIPFQVYSLKFKEVSFLGLYIGTDYGTIAIPKEVEEFTCKEEEEIVLYLIERKYLRKEGSDILLTNGQFEKIKSNSQGLNGEEPIAHRGLVNLIKQKIPESTKSLKTNYK
jgi:hypothetical protein